MARQHCYLANVILPFRRAAAVLGALVVLGTLTACNGAGSSQAGQAASSFAGLAKSDPSKACALLTEHTRHKVEKDAKKSCPDALGDQDLPDASAVRTIDVYGHDARVVLDQDVVFLAQFPDGWKVTAAGCKPQQHRDDPYECEISGG